jgi:hypothetical protein
MASQPLMHEALPLHSENCPFWFGHVGGSPQQRAVAPTLTAQAPGPEPRRLHESLPSHVPCGLHFTLPAAVFEHSPAVGFTFAP